MSDYWPLILTDQINYRGSSGLLNMEKEYFTGDHI